MLGNTAFLCVILTLSASIGRISGKRRLVGGTEVEIKDYPFHVIVFYGIDPVCGGSILTSSHILTSATCVYLNETHTIPTKELFIKYGTSRFIKTTGTRTGAFHYIIHNGFDPTYPYDNDIAVVIVKVPIPFSSVAHPVKLRARPMYNDEQLSVIGHGLYEEGPIADTLRQTLLIVLDWRSCKTSDVPFLTENLQCIGTSLPTWENIRNLCTIDMGGPITMGRNPAGSKAYPPGIQVGLVNSGPVLKDGSKQKDCRGPAPSIMTSVASYQQFIDMATDNLVQWVC